MNSEAFLTVGSYSAQHPQLLGFHVGGISRLSIQINHRLYRRRHESLQRVVIGQRMMQREAIYFWGGQVTHLVPIRLKDRYFLADVWRLRQCSDRSRSSTSGYWNARRGLGFRTHPAHDGLCRPVEWLKRKIAGHISRNRGVGSKQRGQTSFSQ